MSEKRIYGRWAGNPKGHPEDATRCIKLLSDRFSPGGYQCTRPRGHGDDGLYCKQHAPENVAARRKASSDKFNADMARRMKPYEDLRRFRQALEQIAAGHNDPRSLATDVLTPPEAKP